MTARHVTRDFVPLIDLRFENGESVTIDGLGWTHEVNLATDGESRFVVLWNAHGDDGWCICSATVCAASRRASEPSVLLSRPGTVLSISAGFVRGELVICWSERIDGRYCILLSREVSAGEYSHPIVVSDTDSDAFRVRTSNDSKNLYLVWDEYPAAKDSPVERRHYSVRFASWSDGTLGEIASIAGEDEHHYYPDVVSPAEDTAYVSWLSIHDVADGLGIVDQRFSIMTGHLSVGQFIQLNDEKCDDDTRIIGDLRNGLLASKITKGYLGLRRNPRMLCAGESTWLTWEIRPEGSFTSVDGILVGRRAGADGKWDDPVVLADEGYCFSVAPRADADEISYSCLELTDDPDEAIRCVTVNPDSRPAYRRESLDWSRWRREPLSRPHPNRRVYDFENESFRIFWADTHCHSNFSADAEGEIDELVHYARDRAGLDAVSIIDNDYYPHKAHTEAEWQIKNDLAEHYTHPGEFVFFPGYELTYHRKDSTPSFNHRCVSFPHRRGKLVRRIDPGIETEIDFYEALSGTGAMSYPHHCGYRLVDSRFEWNVEVCSSWRVCLEESDFTYGVLEEGHKVGFIGSSDSHRAIPGMGGALTGILANELTPESLFDAYRNRRLIATQGFFIEVDFRISGSPVGSEICLDTTPIIKIDVQAPRDIEEIRIIRNGSTYWTDSPMSRSVQFEIEGDEPSDGDYYFLRIKLLGDPSFNTPPEKQSLAPFSREGRFPHNLARAEGVFAWTSPIWVNPI